MNTVGIRSGVAVIVTLAILSKPVTLLPNNIKIGELEPSNICLQFSALILHSVGGLFEEANSMEEIAFKYAVDHINRNRELLPKSRVMAQIERVPTHDSFYASKRGKI